MPRDDFPRATVEVLAKRAGQRCSNPSCRGLTSGAHSSANKAIVIGVAAHIAAAAPGGPRYDSTMTREQRLAPENGIWLCQTCAKLVDSDIQRFSTADLHAWKARAELESQLAMGNGSDDILRPSRLELCVTDWQIWRDRGTESDEYFIHVSGWAAGDICFGCILRFLHRGDCEEQLHTFRIGWKCGSTMIYADPDEVLSDTTLPPGKWVNRRLEHGVAVQRQSVYEASDSIWLSAKKASDGALISWKLANIDHSTEVPWA